MYLSKKELNNAPTTVYEKRDVVVFLSINNQIVVTRQIHLMHKANHGMLDYLYFKSIIPKYMEKWISKHSMPANLYSIDIITYFNKKFIKDAFELYTFKSNDKIENLVDTNVYKVENTFGHCMGESDDQVILQTKKYGELLASDYGSIDVWHNQTTEVTNAQRRNKNMMPIWQKSMNTRHYDRNNEGYASGIEHSSVNTFVSGYGDDMEMLQKMKLDRYQYDTSL